MPSQSTAASFGTYGAEWILNGYAGAGNVRDLLGSLHNRPAIIAGNAKGVFDEVEKATARLGGLAVTYAANDVGVFLPHVDHMVSLHTPKLHQWVELRRDPSSGGYGNRDFNVHDGGLYGKEDWYQWTGLTPMMALSGMFAAQIAYLMGCSPVVLCGCPNDDTPRFWETTAVTSNVGYVKVQRQVRDEMAYKPDFKKHVRSMSGWSKHFFGGLDDER